MTAEDKSSEKRKLIIGLISITIGYTITFGGLILMLTLAWNVTIPWLFNGPVLNPFQIALIYAVYRLLHFDWMEQFNSYIKSNTREN